MIICTFAGRPNLESLVKATWNDDRRASLVVCEEFADVPFVLYVALEIKVIASP